MKSILLLTGLLAVSLSFAESRAETPASASTPPSEEEIEKCLNPVPAASGPKTAPAVPKGLNYKQVSADELPTADLEGNLDDFKTALRRQIANCTNPAIKVVGPQIMKIGCRTITPQEWCADANKKMLALAEKSPNFHQLMKKARTEFDWYQNSGDEDDRRILFTAYNNPSLEASLEKKGDFIYPIYSTPQDLVSVRDSETGKTVYRKKNEDGTLTPYINRKSIEEGALKGKGLEIAYAKSTLEISLTQIEGSGALLIKQDDGQIKKMQINYDAANGQRNLMVAKLMRCHGLPASTYATADKMRAYYEEHKEQMVKIMNRNPSYVFFRPTATGAKGAAQTEIVGRHSLATDPKVIPLGAIVLINTKRPDDGGTKEFSNLSIAQDVGGAIKGGHIDTYWGEGKYADTAASSMKENGSAFIALMPSPSSACAAGAVNSAEASSTAASAAASK